MIVVFKILFMCPRGLNLLGLPPSKLNIDFPNDYRKVLQSLDDWEMPIETNPPPTNNPLSLNNSPTVCFEGPIVFSTFKHFFSLFA